MKRKRSPKVADSHVRLYGWELELPAYRTLSTDARALLIEFRALYRGGANRIFMSVRQIQDRMGNVGQRRAQRARDELIERGWVRLLEAGSFSRKTKLAAVYALTNEPLEDRDGATAPKDYARWQPQKITVAALTTDGSQNDCRALEKHPEKAPHGSQNDYCQTEKPRSTVVKTATQISYQRVQPSNPAVWLWSASVSGLSGADRLRVCLAWLVTAGVAECIA